MPTKERWAKMSSEEKEKYKLQTSHWRKINKERWNSISKKSYFNTSSPSRRNNMNRTLEEKKQWFRDKSNQRCSRAKQAKFTDELTYFINQEAHELRKLRNKLTGIEWHVDHILPLKGKNVCGLHIWNNLQVIPKTLNLRKGVKNSLST